MAWWDCEGDWGRFTSGGCFVERVGLEGNKRVGLEGNKRAFLRVEDASFFYEIIFDAKV